MDAEHTSSSFPSDPPPEAKGGSGGSGASQAPDSPASTSPPNTGASWGGLIGGVGGKVRGVTERLAFYREHRLLAGSLGALFVVVGIAMSVSLVSCQTTGGGTNVPSAAGRGGAGSGGRATTSNEEATTLARVPSASLVEISAEPEMRVRLATAVGEIELAGYDAGAGGARGAPGAGPVFVGPIGGQTGPKRFAGPLRVRMTAKGWLLTDGAGQSLRLESPGEVVVSADAADWTMGEVVPPPHQVEQATGAPGAMVTVGPVGSGGGGGGGGGAPYPGRIWLVPRSDQGSSTFDVVEHVGLEKYLVGVVVKEMYANWPKEAFKVQAVCARAYALHERWRGQRVRRGFDVEGSTRDQAYAGASSNRAAIEAVNATRGVVLAYKGELLRAYYSSSCGGRTAAARDTWPISKGYEFNLLEPIQAHPRESVCQDSPAYAWTVTRSADDLVKRIKAFGEANQNIVRQITGIYSLEVVETASTGRPSAYKLIEPGGKWYRIKAEDLRVACNSAAPGLSAVTAKERVSSGDLAFKVIAPSNSRLKGQQLLAATKVEISGHGFGHGVGMCQYCTRAMALRGDEWQAMLRVFYPGAEIVRAYR